MYMAINKKLDEIEFTEYYQKSRNKSRIYCDNIFCFDIETSSGFLHKDSNAIEPYTGKSEQYYRDCKKFSLCWIWQFSIDDNVFYGRTLEDFKEFMEELDEIEPFIKIIYVHNFSFEFQFLCNIICWDKVFARENRKPIYANVGNYVFRCSYMLTRQSLENWAKDEKLPVKKLVGNLDYTILRTPLTKVSEKELDYCINDVLVMYYGLLKYRDKYGHVCDIPLTQTGEVRRVIQDKMNCKQEYKYRKNCINLIPDTLEEYKMLVKIFAGGYTHANYIWTDKVVKNVQCKDIASSYPTVMCLEKYPMTRFVKCKPYDEYFNNDKYSYIIVFTCRKLSSKRWNTFLSLSKCDEIMKYRLDNGRVTSAEYVKLTMTNIDFEIFKQCYEWEENSLEVLEFYVSLNDYLSPTFVKYILELYKDKTELKDIEEYANKYAISKQFINSLFGMMVTRNITDDINYCEGWKKTKLNEQIFNSKIEHEKKLLSKTFTAFQFGVWVTAYARRNLWRGILDIDYDVVYCDTDSIKHVGNHEDFFENYNNEIIERENARADMLGISREFFCPKDKHGVEHRLGIFDIETTCEEFKTLGAKKYICKVYDKKQNKDVLKMTVSGVRKKAVEQINNINEFKVGLKFDVEHAKKLLMTYIDDMSEVAWNVGQYDEYKSTYKYGICAQPTTYELGMSADYLSLILANAREVTEICEESTKIL